MIIFFKVTFSVICSIEAFFFLQKILKLNMYK